MASTDRSHLSSARSWPIRRTRGTWAATIRPHVVAGCAKALRKGGWLVIVDETYPSTLAESREPEFLFPVQTGLEELMWGNVIPTRAEQEELLRSAAFAGPIERSLLGAGFTLLTTQR